MGWVWKNDAEEFPVNGLGRIENQNPRSDGGDSLRRTRKVVRSQCRTEEVEPGKFLRKCERTEEILRDSIGRPAELVQSNKEYTEEDVTDEMLRGSLSSGPSSLGPFDFPGLRSDVESIEKSFDFAGLRSDMEAIEHSLFGGLGRFFEVAEEMRNSLFGGSFKGSSSSPKSRGIPIESGDDRQQKKEPESGHIDLSDLARDV